MFRILFLTFLLLAGCQSAQQKNEDLVRDRIVKLRSLSKWRPVKCDVETHLTEPARARYAQMFASEKKKLKADVWSYKWNAREDSCEVRAEDRTPLAKNHLSFLQTAFCDLLETHFVHSPFDDLKIKPEDVVATEDEKVQVRTSPEPGLGIYLDPQTVTFDTHTKSRGILHAVYSLHDQQWLPDRLEENRPKSRFVVDQIEYSDIPVGGRRMIKSFWISIGESDVFPHTQVTLSNCETY